MIFSYDEVFKLVYFKESLNEEQEERKLYELAKAFIIAISECDKEERTYE